MQKLKNYFSLIGGLLQDHSERAPNKISWYFFILLLQLSGWNIVLMNKGCYNIEIVYGISVEQFVLLNVLANSILFLLAMLVQGFLKSMILRILFNVLIFSGSSL